MNIDLVKISVKIIVFEEVMISLGTFLGYQPNSGPNNPFFVKKVSFLEIDHFDLLHLLEKLFFLNYFLSPHHHQKYIEFS